jgi:hypothetical protein
MGQWIEVDRQLHVERAFTPAKGSRLPTGQEAQWTMDKETLTSRNIILAVQPVA